MESSLDPKRVPPADCPECGTTLDAATCIDGDKDVRPGDGDVSICINCGVVLQFKGDALVIPDDVELLIMNKINPEDRRRLLLAQKSIQSRKFEESLGVHKCTKSRLIG